MHYLLFYDYVPDYLQRRDEYRKQHLKQAWESQQRGELVIAGVLDEPIDSAVLFFQVDTPDLIEEFVRNDPYVQNGLVTSWRIRPWNTVVGKEAVNPVHMD